MKTITPIELNKFLTAAKIKSTISVRDNKGKIKAIKIVVGRVMIGISLGRDACDQPHLDITALRLIK